jgi:hypothetical protein
VLGRWVKLADDTWGVRTEGRVRVGSIVTVRFKDRREPARVTIAEILEDEGTTMLCRTEKREGA